MITWLRTERGFVRGEFKDLYASPCSIQESSLATDNAIWVGCDHELTDPNGRPCGARMHLTREMAHALADYLLHFYYTGELPEPGET